MFLDLLLSFSFTFSLKKTNKHSEGLKCGEGREGQSRLKISPEPDRNANAEAGDPRRETDQRRA